VSKTINATLLTHKALTTTTLCRLLKLKAKDGTIWGFANLDIDVAYDDNSGDGSIDYKSANGLVMARLATAAGTSVDNTDLSGVAADVALDGVTEEQIRAGLLDYASCWVYEVNYNDLTTGRHEVKARGNAGTVAMSGEQFRAEFRSLTQHFKQPIGEVTSITCRARFGDTRCGKSYTWVSATVTSVDGTEPNRIFTCSALAGATDEYVPGVVLITSGDNSGKEVEVEAFTTGGIIELTEGLYYTPTVGMTLDIRRDCSKVWDDTDHGCKYHWSTDWNLHFRGEPLIPLGQEGELSTPGAQL